MEAAYIMWKRQLKLYLRKKERFISSLAQPLFFLVAMGFGFGPIFEKSGGGNYMQFLTPGIVGMTLMFGSIFNGVSLIWDRQFGFLKETLVAPVSRVEILAGRTLGGATTGTIQGLVVLFISTFFGFSIGNLLLFPLAVIFMFLTSLLFTLLGTAIATKLTDMHAFPMIMNFLVMPLFFLSGALFPLEGLPLPLQIVTTLNPLSYAVDGLRGTLANGSLFGLTTNLFVLTILTLILIIIGTRLFEKMQV